MDLPASQENLNLLYDCALEFGEHWMRPVIEWVRELLPDLETEKQVEIAVYVEGVREAVNDFIAGQYDYRSSAMRITDEKIKEWIRTRYPWMSQANISHGLSQGKYYAWRG
jgi:hypothetical protein